MITRKGMVLVLAIAVCAAGVISSGCSRKSDKAASGSIQVKGSDTMVNLGQAWAESFMKKHPGSGVSVTGGGSGTGIAALLNKTTDIAESSRTIKPEEIEQAKKNGITLKEIKVAYDGIAVVVNPANKVSALTMAQLADVFMGKITNWKQLGGRDEKIVLLSREVNSGTHVYFKEHVLNKGDSKGTNEFSSSALLMPSSQAIADEVEKNTAAVGYYGMGYISNRQKVVPISSGPDAEPVMPSEETVLSGKYPISRPLFMYTDGEPSGLTKEFIDFVLSDEGAKIVRSLDFVPLK